VREHTPERSGAAAWLALLVIALVGAHAAGAVPNDATVGGAELIRSVPDAHGSPVHFYWLDARQRADRELLLRLGQAACPDFQSCAVYVWSDREAIPQAMDMAVRSMQTLVAIYQARRDAGSYLRQACWLYQDQAAGEREVCFAMPGTLKPWERRPGD
jgi:hypothetical protein